MSRKRFHSMQEKSTTKMVIGCQTSFPFLLLIFLSSLLCAQDRAKLENDRKKLEKEIEFTKKLLEETTESKKNSLSQLETLKRQIQLREKVISSISKEMELIDEQLDETNAIIKALEKDLTDLKKEYAEMLYNMYKNRSALNQLIFLFNAKGFNDAFARVRYLQQFGEFRKKQAHLIEETKLTLVKKRQEQAGRKTEKQLLLNAEQEQQAKLNEEKQAKDRLVASLKQQERKLKQDIEKKQRDADLLSKKIEELILKEIAAARKKAEEEAAAKAKTTATEKKISVLSLTPEAAKLSADFASNQGRLPWPVEKGIIASTFGTHPHPVLKDVTVVNNGVDIKTNENSQVRTLFQGTVVTVMYNPGFQRAVLVRHGEYFTVYSNLKEVFVSSGDEIATKQPIGLVYTDEKDGSSKVHLEIWKNTQKLNPALWIYPNNQ
ncbi:MAG TPA: peptidoglycan DD-metalloendopeptidase family protein [Chitinophagales bacterium]|nr:peptidoglycan DD-metalloendopeptidase family protein [Chitinophagales bacterium]